MKVVQSTDGKHHLTEQEKLRIQNYNAKYANTPPHERFFADMRIKTAILNGTEVDDE